MSGLIVIPARWESSRMPGKPLAPIAGQPLLARTVDLARRATRGMDGIRIVVAADDGRVHDLAATLECESIDTDPSLSSGSSRALAAARRSGSGDEHIVNLQGDTPFVPVDAVRSVLGALKQGARVATPVVRLDWAALDALRAHKRSTPFSGTTCIVDAQGNARWFSKQIIPAIRREKMLRGEAALSPVFRHIGLYGYAREALERFDAAPPSHYEIVEGLEQLRFLEMGIAIKAVFVAPPPFDSSGIDTPADIERAEALILTHGDPYGS